MIHYNYIEILLEEVCDELGHDQGWARQTRNGPRTY